MPTIMVTKALWNRIGEGELRAQPDDALGLLGNWSLRELPTRHGELAMFLSQRTRLVVVTPLVPLAPLLRWFERRLEVELRHQGVRDESIRGELAALETIRFGKNTDRSLTGSGNDLLWLAECNDEPAPSLLDGCDVLQRDLNGTPHANRKPPFADQSVRILFGMFH